MLYHRRKEEEEEKKTRECIYIQMYTIIFIRTKVYIKNPEACRKVGPTTNHMPISTNKNLLRIKHRDH